LRIIPVKPCRKYTQDYTGAGSVVKALSGPETPIAPAPASRPESGRSGPESSCAGIGRVQTRIVTRTPVVGTVGRKLKAHGGRPGGRFSLHSRRSRFAVRRHEANRGSCFQVAGAGLEPASSRFAPNAPGRVSCPCLPVSPSRQGNDRPRPRRRKAVGVLRPTAFRSTRACEVVAFQG
jgi:hypothetical protein